MLLLIEIPDLKVSHLKLRPDDLSPGFLRELALDLYARGTLPIGKAMKLCQTTRREFDELLKSRNLDRPFDETEQAFELV